MAHFARKPTTVDATQWHDGDEPVYDLRGNLIDARDGDWILRDTVTGEVETISDSWFQANYQETDSPNTVPAPPETASSTSAVNTPGAMPGVQPPPPPPPAADPTSQPDPRDAEIADLRAQLAAAQANQSPTVPAGTAPSTGTDSGSPQTGPGGLVPSDSPSNPSTPTGVVPGAPPAQ